LTAAELARAQAPRADDVRRLADYAGAAGLTIREVSPARHDVLVVGRSGDVARAFGVDFELFDSPIGPRRSHRGEIHLPVTLHRAVVGVLGLDTMPRHLPAAAAARVGGNFPPATFAKYYRFPEQFTGRGERIAILSFGGGVHRSDLASHFRKVAGVTAPRIQVITVGDATNAPMPRRLLAQFIGEMDRRGAAATRVGDAIDPSLFAWAKGTFESTVDLEIAGSLAPGAEFRIIFADPDASGFYHAIYEAIGLGPRRRPPATVVSLSWGTSESSWNGHLPVIDQALRAACLVGATVVASTGDFGSVNARRGRVAAVNFPASSPKVLAVGGTELSGPPDPQANAEVVWNEKAIGLHAASGGGLSGYWPRPGYQRRLGYRLPRRSETIWIDPVNPGPRLARAVPDVAGLAARTGGYRVLAGGVETTAAGTSCAAPLWAALIARLNQALGRPLGWINGTLYQPDLRPGFRDVTVGTNRVSRGRARAYTARVGHDCCTGLGSPLGEELLRLLRHRARRASRPR
jgi:kumamolisin